MTHQNPDNRGPDLELLVRPMRYRGPQHEGWSSPGILRKEIERQWKTGIMKTNSGGCVHDIATNVQVEGWRLTALEAANFQ